MSDILKNIIDISRFYGVNKEYVIAGGGNTSCKDDKHIWVKASGTSLADIAEDGFVCLSREKLKDFSTKQYSSDVNTREVQVKNDLEGAIVNPSGRRPSVESSLHDLINYTYVVHTHPTLINALLCSKDAAKHAATLFPEALYIKYTDPGYILFSKVLADITVYRKQKGYDPKIILLENHGIFVSSNSLDEIKSIYSNVEKIILSISINKEPSTTVQSFDTIIDKAYSSTTGINTQGISRNITCELINGFITNAMQFGIIATAFTPDHIVYCKSRYLIIEDENSNTVSSQISSFKEKWGYFPKIIGIKGKGLYIVSENEKQTGIVQELILNMMKISFHSEAFGGSKPMTDRQIHFIENWEAENYRKSMSTK